MKIRNELLLSGALVVGLLMFGAVAVSAQSAGPVRVIPLANSGYEQPYSLAYSPDGKYVVVGGLSGIYLFDAQSDSQIGYIQTNARVRSLQFIPHTATLAAALFDDTIKLWQVPQAQLSGTLTGHHAWVRSLSISADGSLLASASDDNTIRIWTLPEGRTVLTIDRDTTGVRAVALSPDGKLVAGALEDNTVRVWQAADGKPVYTLTGHTNWVRTLAFSPDGSTLASGGFDMTVRLWRMSDGQLLQTLKGHTSSILKLAFSPDGTVLASSAVDETVRLWQTADGRLLHILPGYTDFIYALSFSPDGRVLASGGGDNALRLWDMAALPPLSAADSAPAGNFTEIQSTTSDCRQCHHRQGQARPPRVVDLACENCHAGGIGQSFCIAFPRSENVGPLPISYSALTEISGLPVPSNKLAALIAAPGNGETLYVKGDFMAPERVSGTISYAEPESITAVDVHLDIFSDGQKTASVDTHPTRDGSFTFDVAINPNSPTPQLTRPATKICLVCHGDYQPQAGLPVGTVRLVVTATAPDGQQASDERWIRVDSSGETSVPVQVSDDQTGKPLSGVSVDARTILYEWRDRYGDATTGHDGNATLSLEALSQASTTYDLSVPPQVVNGILYASQPIQLELAPGATAHPPVLLEASVQQGRINGAFHSDGDSAIPGPMKVWAIESPAGPVYQVASEPQGSFAFGSIPVSSYLITPDLFALAQRGESAALQQVDLIHAPHAEAAISVTAARPLLGTVLDESGRAVPFAWVQVNGKGAAQSVDPASGEFLIGNTPEELSFVTVNAPGFYSQSQHISPGQKTATFHLVPEPETQQVSWGEGQVAIPAQTTAKVAERLVTLDNGWLWGEGSDSQPLTVDVGNTRVTIPAGQFAVENAGGRTGWLYLLHGNAQVQFAGAVAPVQLRDGQMIALLPSVAPLPIDKTVVLSLHPALSESPIPELLEPSVAARVENWLEKAGIGVAQTITFITYFLSLVALVVIPLLALFWINRRRNAASQEKH